ncbi:MAG: DUF4743 domain-containing protein [Burkholderiales bacterium]
MDRTITILRIEARLTRLLAPPSVSLTPLVAEGRTVGRLTAARAERLARFDGIARRGAALVVEGDRANRDASMEAIARTLAGESALTAWRDERYAVRNAFDEPPLFVVERAAARYLGIRTYAAHVNGLVRTGEGVKMWLARRSPRKAIDPGMLDNLVGGGIGAGASIEGTVFKESWEEAGIEAGLAAQAARSGELAIFREQPDGIQDEIVYAHDLWLPAGWRPANQDGEAVEHRLVSLGDVAEIIASDAPPDAMTADASLVALDCLVRLGELPEAGVFDALRRPAVPN